MVSGLQKTTEGLHSFFWHFLRCMFSPRCYDYSLSSSFLPPLSCPHFSATWQSGNEHCSPVVFLLLGFPITVQIGQQLPRNKQEMPQYLASWLPTHIHRQTSQKCVYLRRNSPQRSGNAKQSPRIKPQKEYPINVTLHTKGNKNLMQRLIFI